MTALTRDRMIEAMRANDARFDGRFYVGVHSTGIYCLPSCGARLPKVENVRFYLSREEALAAGLRACRRCRPNRYPDTLADWVPRVISHMCTSGQGRLTERDLAEIAGVDITTVRRHFKQYLGMTPLAFSRRLRLERAARLLESGQDSLSVAFECGWESVSGFREAFRKQFGVSPGSYHEKRH